MRKYLSVFMSILTALTFFSLKCGGSSSDTTNDPDVDNSRFKNRADELAYITKLSNDDSLGVLSGQCCGDNLRLCDGGYNEYIEALHDKNGKYVGIITAEYGYNKVCTLDELKQINAYLTKYWRKGGLVMVGWSPANPWGTAKDWSDVEPKKSPGNLEDLITPGSTVYNEWIADLDRTAEALRDLKGSGVIVLWRPIQEMNGNSFWWGHYSDDDTLKYQKLWKHMYDYFTNTKGLDNLIWVFGPESWGPGHYSSSYPYPGDSYVDIIAPTIYRDNLDFTECYDDLIKFSTSHGKPIAFSECGPSPWDGSPLDGSFDNRLYATQLKKCPKIAFFISWSSWFDKDTKVNMSLVDNMYASELLNDPYIINMGDF